jgi:hypothetical protein
VDNPTIDILKKAVKLLEQAINSCRDNPNCSQCTANFVELQEIRWELLREIADHTPPQAVEAFRRSSAMLKAIKPTEPKK